MSPSMFEQGMLIRFRATSKSLKKVDPRYFDRCNTLLYSECGKFFLATPSNK